MSRRIPCHLAQPLASQGIRSEATQPKCLDGLVAASAGKRSFDSACARYASSSFAQDDMLFLPSGQIFFLDRRHNHVVRVDHLVEVDLRHLREQFVSVQLGEPIIIVNPAD